MDIKFSGRPTKYSNELAEILALIYKTMLITDLAQEYNASEVTLHRWLRRAGLTKYYKNGGESAHKNFEFKKYT